MAIARLEFKLPEEKYDFILARNGEKYYSALVEIKKIMRKHWKYEAKMKDCWKEIEGEVNEINFEEVE